MNLRGFKLLDKVRSIVWGRCNFYISPHYSAAVLDAERREVRYYYGTMYIVVHLNTNAQQLEIYLWYKDTNVDFIACELKGWEVEEIEKQIFQA